MTRRRQICECFCKKAVGHAVYATEQRQGTIVKKLCRFHPNSNAK